MVARMDGGLQKFYSISLKDKAQCGVRFAARV